MLTAAAASFVTAEHRTIKQTYMTDDPCEHGDVFIIVHRVTWWLSLKCCSVSAIVAVSSHVISIADWAGKEWICGFITLTFSSIVCAASIWMVCHGVHADDVTQ